MKLVILGAPGAGKGTQAENLAKDYGIPHISTGDILRINIKEGTILGKEAKEYMDKGLLVPDELIIGLINERIKESDCSKGFIFDGFPRTINQAEKLDELLLKMETGLDAVLNIYVDDEAIVRRMSGRRVCPSCGASFHVVYNPPAQGDSCTKCGAKVAQREDDREETVKVRLKTYHDQTKPLIDFYSKKGLLKTAIGHEELSDTTAEVRKVLRGI